MQSEAVPDVKKVVEELQSKGKSSVGLAGFCWGGKLILETGLKMLMPDPAVPWESASVFKQHFH